MVAKSQRSNWLISLGNTLWALHGQDIQSNHPDHKCKANIPLRTGFMYNHWKKGLNVMDEKTMGDFNVKKLRIIFLFEVGLQCEQQVDWQSSDVSSGTG